MRMVYDFLPAYEEGGIPPKTIDRNSIRFGGQLRGLQRRGKRPCMIALERDDIRSILLTLAENNPVESEKLRYYFVSMFRCMANE